MKNLTLLLIVMVIPVIMSAQGQKGMKVIEGNLSYYLLSDESVSWHNNEVYEYENQRFVIRPKIGWFISEKSVLGVGLGYEYQKSSSTSPIFYGSKYNMLLFNPYFLNYQKIAERFYFTTTVDFILGFGSENGDEEFEQHITQYTLSAQPGLTYFISDKWALKTNFGNLFYTKRKSKYTGGYGDEEPELEDTSYGLSLSMDSFSLGIGYYF